LGIMVMIMGVERYRELGKRRLSTIGADLA
jgi:hypothetical protein